MDWKFQKIIISLLQVCGLHTNDVCLENQKTNPDGVLEKCVEKINSISSSDFEKVELGIKCSNPPFLARRYRYKKEFIMKKTFTILLTTFISFSLFAKTPEYLSKKGKVFVEYFRSDDGDFYEGIPITCCFWIE